MNSQVCGVFGLGSMGMGIANSLVQRQFKTFGFDVVSENVATFVSNGGSAAELSDVAQDLDVVIIVVLNAAQTQEVLFGDNGVVPKLKSGAVVVSCTTVPPEFAKLMEAECETYNISYLDAPISGGSIKANNGQLTYMASGKPEAFSKSRSALEATSETIFVLGESAGAGSAMKSVNQLLAGVHIAAMAEALTFGITQGVKPEQFLEVISKCAGTSWMLENRAPHIIEGDYTPHSSVDIWPKDLGIVLDIAKSAKFGAPLTAAAMQQYLAASEAGWGREDDAAVAKVYARNAGIKLPGEDS